MALTSFFFVSLCLPVSSVMVEQYTSARTTLAIRTCMRTINFINVPRGTKAHLNVSIAFRAGGSHL